MEQTAEVAESSWQLATNPTQDACDLLALCHLRMHTLMRGGPVAPHTTAFQGLLCWDSNPHGTPGRHARGGVVVQSSHNVQGAALGRGGDQATWTTDLAQLAVLSAAYPKQGSAPLAAQLVLAEQCVQLSRATTTAGERTSGSFQGVWKLTAMSQAPWKSSAATRSPAAAWHYSRQLRRCSAHNGCRAAGPARSGCRTQDAEPGPLPLHTATQDGGPHSHVMMFIKSRLWPRLATSSPAFVEARRIGSDPGSQKGFGSIAAGADRKERVCR